MNISNSFMFQKTLKAQTPLIHFQYNQSGATLRATEVKPKLDRFLLTHYGDKISDKWKVKADTPALNYKLHFEACGKQETVELGKGDFDIFYGNMGDSSQYKKGIFGDVTMTVICTISELRRLIEEHIAEFFAVTNFGTMQGKGFGSYTVEGTAYHPEFIADCLKRAYGAKACYSFAGGPAPFKALKTVYGIMKSGVNFTPFRDPDSYQRSLLFLFMHNEYKIGNEKAWLKQKGFVPSDTGKNANRWHRNSDEHTAYYVRALLGIGDHIDFIKDVTQKKTRENKITVTIANTSKTVERFHSPIFFKIIDGNVYFVARRIEKEIFGAEFKFTTPGGSGILAVPTEEVLGEDFIDRFMAYCKNELSSGILKKFKETAGITIQEVG